MKIKVGAKYSNGKHFAYISYKYYSDYTLCILNSEGDIVKTIGGNSDKIMEYLCDNGYTEYDGKIKYKSYSMLANSMSIREF